MKAIVMNAKQVMGKKKSDGSPYEMYVVTVALPLRPFSSANYNMQGFGYDVAELPLDPAAYPKFSVLKEPQVLDLKMETVILFGEIKDTVVDFVKPA